MKATLYNQNGTRERDIDVPESVFGLKWNSDLIHQIATSLSLNRRRIFAHTKDRREVSGGGKKPWQQKGTGRARHGSIRSPLWRGGGITFGPRNTRNFKRKINVKEGSLAIRIVLSRKFRDGEILFLDALSLPEAKTKKAHETVMKLAGIPGFGRISARKENGACVYTPEKDPLVERAFRNFGSIRIAPVAAMNLLDILNFKYVIIVAPEKSLQFFKAVSQNAGDEASGAQEKKITKARKSARAAVIGGSETKN
ncbi:MAG: 50S ribosomal protein L4 [Patescibacteria group bacterium]